MTDEATAQAGPGTQTAAPQALAAAARQTTADVLHAAWGVSEPCATKDKGGEAE